MCRTTSACGSARPPATRISDAAAADVVHLLTELVDNALAYSPPTTTVTLSSTLERRRRPDRDQRRRPRHRRTRARGAQRDPARPAARSRPTRRAGWACSWSSRLAERHGITVSLRRNSQRRHDGDRPAAPALLRGSPALRGPRRPHRRPQSRPSRHRPSSRSTNEPETRARAEAAQRSAPARLTPAAPSRPAAAARRGRCRGGVGVPARSSGVEPLAASARASASPCPGGVMPGGRLRPRSLASGRRQRNGTARRRAGLAEPPWPRPRSRRPS